MTSEAKGMTISPLAGILRRLGSYLRKNKLYFALRELGYVARTMFLLRYISEAEPRGKLFNRLRTRASGLTSSYSGSRLGGDKMIAENVRDERRARKSATSHVKRFGQYQLHARRAPEPLPFIRKPPNVETGTVSPSLAAAGSH